MINIFFQEWAPVFPVLHRPTFLSLYEQYVSGADNMTDKKSIAMLNLVFGISALSSDVCNHLSQIFLSDLLTLNSHVTARMWSHSKLNGKVLWNPS